MGLGDYIKARRLGEATYKEQLNAGKYPYLQVLEEILSKVTIVSERNLGTIEIPMDRVRGTYAAGRRSAFAADFMPLLEDDTEFAEKWIFLCDSLKDEGLRDPVKAYEFMNYYYIMEGNKRVSVTRYLGADSIPGKVTRLVPRFEFTRESLCYYEYLDFYKKCPENYLVFNEPGSYTKLNFRIGKRPEDEWTEEDRDTLKSSFYRFRNAFRAVVQTEDPENIVGDAFLSYLNVYPYGAILNKSSMELQKELQAMKEELQLQGSRKNVRLMLDEDDVPKRGIFSFLSSPGTGSKVLRIDFIHDTDSRTSEAVYLHDLGVNALKNEYGSRIEVRNHYSVNPFTDIYHLLGECAGNGSDLVFTTSRVFLDPTLSAAVRFPKTRFLCCTLNAAHRYLRTYYARFYEVTYLCGIIAGSLTKDDKIGYLADLPVPETMANINAFALGVQLMRPSAKVHVQWLLKKDNDHLEYFRKNNIHLISGRTMMNQSSSFADYGLFEYENGSMKRLAMPLLDWGTVYKKIVESVRNGAYDMADNTGDGYNALNYWWGLSTGAVDLVYTKDLPRQTIRFVENLKDAIREGFYPVFSGKIIGKFGSNAVTISDSHDSVLPQDELLHMHWLLDNVETREPGLDELTDYARILLLSYINN
ncbi:MAG: BMP family ABC transporter substrate-binding protein [Lachnospiraceae bacterium]|nr:BMP family ABC transporter substrate-binding protein [Lachnospiraceae bacterium]